MNATTQPGQPIGNPQQVPNIEVPISDRPGHPVNSPGTNVYFSRTDNLVGLNDAQRTQALAEAIRGVGPGKVLLLEANGPRDGSYVDELRRSLPAALAMVPKEQQPEIRLFVSDGRPVIGNRDNPGGPYNDFTTFLQGLDRAKPNSGIVYEDRSQAVPRAVPNWNNPQVVDYFVRERVQPAVQLAKDLGIGTVVVDDHIGVPTDNAKANTYPMSAFKQVNGLTDRQVQDVITGAYNRVLGTIEAAGLNTGLSSAAEPGVNTAQGPTGALRFGIDMARLAPRSDSVEIQGYRQSGDAVRAMTDNFYANVRDNFEQYRDVKEFKVALVTRASGKDLSEQVLIDQQAAVKDFGDRLGALYRSRGEEPPKVTTSLWAHQHFYEEPTLRLGDNNQRVKELQENLNAAGIRVNGEPLPTTGTFAEITQQAVRQYQQQNGLAVTGEAGKETLVALGIYPKQDQPFNQPGVPTPTQSQPIAPPATEQPTSSVLPGNSQIPESLSRDPLYPQAQEALKRLPEGTFANGRELDNMALALVSDARKQYPPPSEPMRSIAEVQFNTRGDGLIALERGGDDPMQKRAFSGLAEGKNMPPQDPSTLVAQGNHPQQGVPQQTVPQRPDQAANPVIAQHTPEPDQPTRSMRV